MFSEYNNENTKSSFRDDTIYKLIWGNKNGSNICKIIYIIQLNKLFVTGDLGDAIYIWSDKINFKFLAECDPQYFKSKCRASKFGRNYVEWDDKIASKRIREYAEENEMEETKEPIIQDLFDNIDTKEEMMHWIENNRDEVDEIFGDNWWEYLPSVGEVIHWECLAHLIGIKMAIKNMSKTG